ncbi:MAG: AAA family ATPase [Planctomycetaceae bacterium]|nr:AAA family ATPase [Planctomycetaceae bacterium]
MPEIEEQVTDAQAKAFGDNLRDWLAERKLSQTFVGDKIGVTPGVISGIVRGTYKGDTKNIIAKLTSFMDTYDRRQRVEKGKGFVDTEIAKLVFTIIKQVQIFSDEDRAKIGVIIGDSGQSKSTCLKQYAKVHFSDSAYVELDDTMTSAAMFAAIAKALRIDDAGGLKVLTQRIVKHLAGREMVILLDEASGLNAHKLNQLRQIFSVRCKCPLLLAGNAHLKTTLNLSQERRGNECLDQFRSRILGMLDLDEIASNPGGGGLYTAEDIGRLYQYGGIRLTKEAIKKLRQICLTPETGRLGTCSVIISAMHKMSRIMDEGIITEDDIIKTIRKLGLFVKDRLPFLVDVETSEPQNSKAKTA